MIFGKHYIAIEYFEVPLAFSRLEPWPGDVGIPQAPLSERDFRPRRRAAGMVDVHAEKAYGYGLIGRRGERGIFQRCQRQADEQNGRERYLGQIAKHRHKGKSPFPRDQLDVLPSSEAVAFMGTVTGESYAK